MNQFILDKIVSGINKTNSQKDIYEKVGWDGLLNLYKQSTDNGKYDFSDFDGWEKVIIDNKIHAIFHLNKQKSKKWIVVCHGYTSSKESTAISTWLFNKYGYNILAFDFLNHGESAEGLVTFGINEVKTLDTVVDYLNQNFSVKEIGLVGFSMGAHTVNIYALKPDIDVKKKRIKFIVSDSTYYSIKEVMAIIGRIKFQIVENMFNSLLESLIEYYKTEYHIDLLEYDLNKLKSETKRTIPALIFHTKKDNVTNYRDSERIYALRHKLSRKDALHIYENGEHLQAQNLYFDEYNQAIKDFLNKIK